MGQTHGWTKGPAPADAWTVGRAPTADVSSQLETSPYEETASDPQPLIGFAKEAVARAVTLGRLVHKIPGLDQLLGRIPEDAATRLGLDPSNPDQRAGQSMEQISEFMVPASGAERFAVSVGNRLVGASPKIAAQLARFVPRVAAQAGSAATVAEAQGGDPVTAAALGAAGPVLGAGVSAAARGLAKTGTAMARTAIKPTVAALKKMVGSHRNLDAKAEEIAQFIVDNGLTTAAKARQMFNAAELSLQSLLKFKNAPTDAATRAQRYLEALERSASKQGLAADDVATVRNSMAELLTGQMGEDVVTMVPKPHPTLLGADGKPITVLVPQTARALRGSVPAAEALESARSSGQWSTKRAWGDQKGVATEAAKTVERAQRDAVKAAVPEAKAILQTQGKTLTAAEILDRMAQREGNRAGVGLGEKAMAALEMAHGKLPLMATASNFVRNNGLKMGVWADRLSKAIEQNNVKEVTEILGRFGVGVSAQGARP